MSTIFEEVPSADSHGSQAEITVENPKNDPFMEAMDEADILLAQHSGNGDNPDNAITKFLEAMSYSSTEDELQETQFGLARALRAAGRFDEAMQFANGVRGYYKATGQTALEQRVATLIRNIQIDVLMVERGQTP